MPRLNRTAVKGIAAMLLAGLLGSALDILFPLPFKQTGQQYARTVASREGEPLRAFADANGVWRYPVTLAQVSPRYIEALLNYEDRWFYWHPGVNPLALLRSLTQYIGDGRIVSGGSTLTMQVARLIDPHSRTVWGKLKQILRALQLEWHFSKREILTYYLNHAPFGGPLEGVQAASYTYLGKSAQRLSHAEAALLAVLPQAPSRYRPDKHPEAAEKARNKVLERLQTRAVWSAERIQEAKIEKVNAYHHYPALVAPLLARRLKHQTSHNQALITTLDYELQQSLEEHVQNYVERLPDKTSAAVLVVENANLAIRAYIGSSDFLDANRYGHIDMIRATRSPGSTLKPFLYGLALDAGLIHSASLLTDAPVSIAGYRPHNFDGEFNGAVSVSDALVHSLNMPAVQVLHHLGANNFISQLKNAGLKVALPPGATANLSIILGGMDTHLESLVSLYTALANKGLSGNLRYLPGQPVQQQRFLSEGAAFIIRDILTRNLRGERNNIDAIAWKTGTSYGFRDMWSIGVSDRYTIGVWLGRPDGTPLPGHYGARTAAPLLFSIMARVQPNRPFSRSGRKQPDSVSKSRICWPLGKSEASTPPELCHRLKTAWLLDQNIPGTFAEENDWFSNPITVLINPETGHQINANCSSGTGIPVKKALWPLATEPWIEASFRRQHQLPVYDKNCTAGPGQDYQSLAITGVRDHSVLRAQPTLPSVELDVIGGLGKLYWYLNGHEIAVTEPEQTLRYRFKTSGRHQLTVIDSRGHTAVAHVAVELTH